MLDPINVIVFCHIYKVHLKLDLRFEHETIDPQVNAIFHWIIPH